MLRGMLMEPGNIPVSTSSLGLRTSQLAHYVLWNSWGTDRRNPHMPSGIPTRGL